MKKLLLSVLISFLIIGGGVGALQTLDNDINTFWVRTDGNDTCSGQNNMSYVENDTDCAFATPLAGNAALTSPGMTLNIVSGIYYTEGIPAVSVGNATHRITYRGVGTPKPVLIGNYSLSYLNGIGLGTGDNYITIENLNFSNYTDATGDNGFCVMLSGVHDIVIKNVAGVKCGYAGLQIGGGSYNIFVTDTTMQNAQMANFRTSGLTTHNITFENIGTNNSNMGEPWDTDYEIAFTKGSYDIYLKNSLIDCTYFKTLGRALGITGSNTGERNHDIYVYNFTSNNLNHGIQIRGSSYDISIDRFYFTGGNGEAFYSTNEDGSNNTNITISNSIIDCGGQGGSHGGIDLISPIHDVVISNVTVMNCNEGASTSGIYAMGHNITVKNSIVYNNTYGIILSGYDNTVLNSVIYDNTYGIRSTYKGVSDPGNNTVKNVIFDNNGRNFWNVSVNYSLRGSYKISEDYPIGSVLFSNCVYGNPLFVNNTTLPYDFHLRSQYGRWDGYTWVYDTETSPAIGTGDPTSDNSLSPWGGVIEMGAYGNTIEASKSYGITPPSITSYSPPTPVTQDEGTTNSFTVTTDQTVTSNWFLDNIQQSETSQTFTNTWSYTDAGTHNITYSGTNENGTARQEWDVTVNDVAELPSSSWQVGSGGNVWTGNVIHDNTTQVQATGYIELRQEVDDYVSYWRFDENRGTIAHDENTTSNITGTLQNMESEDWVDGKYRKALRFDGVDERVAVGNFFSGYDQTQGGTITLWFQPAELVNEGIGLVNYGSTYDEGPLIYHRDDRLRAHWHDATTAELEYDNALSVNTWIYIAVYWNSSRWWVRAGDSTRSAANSFTDEDSATNYIGYAPLYTAGHVNGTIDDVRVFERKLRDLEINQTRDNEHKTIGNLTSITKDAETIGAVGDIWNQIKFEGSLPANTYADIYINSPSCGGFVPVQSSATSGTIYSLPSCAQERNAQWKLQLRTDDQSLTPEIYNVTMFLTTAESPPLITLTSIAQDTTPPYYSATPIPRANFTTDVTASCRIALTDIGYDAMTNNCDDYGTTHSCLSPTIADGTHILYLACTDGTTAHTAANNYEAQVTIDTTSPEVTIDVPANNTEISGAITLTATATDANGVDIVEFYLIGMDLNGVDPITCAPSSGLIGTANKAGNTFTLAWTVSNCPGNHWIVASAYDPAQNYNLNYSYVTIPSICTESWSCTEWSECSGGVQTRICTDANNCGTTINKPAEVAGCGINKRYYLQVTGTIECT